MSDEWEALNAFDTREKRTEAIARLLNPMWFWIMESGEAPISNYPGQTAKYQARARASATKLMDEWWPQT